MMIQISSKASDLNWTTSLKKARLLRFQSSSTAISDGRAQKLENDHLHDSEFITTKLSIQNCRKWKAIAEGHVEICIDWTPKWYKVCNIWRFIYIFLSVDQYERLGY